MKRRIQPVRGRRRWSAGAWRGRAGLTMIELLVAMVLMFVVLGAIYGIWFGLQRSYSFTEDDFTAQDQARRALTEMVEFIRTARKPDPAPTEALNVVIYRADANMLICWTDTDRDAEHDLELVRFRVDTGTRTLYRDESPTEDPTFSGANTVRLISGWVSNNDTKPLFRYVGADGAPMPTPVADPTMIREVHIHLLIDVFEQNRPLTHELRSVVQPRNLRQY